MGCTAAKANTVAPVVDPQPGSLMPSTEETLSHTASNTPQKAGIHAMANTGEYNRIYLIWIIHFPKRKHGVSMLSKIVKKLI